MAPAKYETRVIKITGMKRAVTAVLNDTVPKWTDDWKSVPAAQKKAVTSALIAKKAWVDPSFQSELSDLKKKGLVPKNKIKTEVSLQKMLEEKKAASGNNTWRTKLIEQVTIPTHVVRHAILYEKQGLGLFEGLPLGDAKEQKANLVAFVHSKRIRRGKIPSNE